jgi:hypothetical protein
MVNLLGLTTFGGTTIFATVHLLSNLTKKSGFPSSILNLEWSSKNLGNSRTISNEYIKEITDLFFKGSVDLTPKSQKTFSDQIFLCSWVEAIRLPWDEYSQFFRPMSRCAAWFYSCDRAALLFNYFATNC